jgi:hypothetical protein
MEVWIRRNDLDAVDFRGIVGRFQTMYESLWQEDPRFVDQDTAYDPPFFELFSFPSDDQPQKFGAEFGRLEERDGFAVAIESYPDGDRENAELIFASHFFLGGAEPSGNEEEDDDASDNDHLSDTLSTVSQEAASPDRDAPISLGED